ncbi:hypothetical protein KIN20_032841 [Parelaphostrongylus tenuis]|uniref:Uncharacterized protein n=1 Tax=Parelaphostrongylus tenuis TaxID=148309 RepID=A0AAD5WID9_PARTN|nr:hypothetical protein KIN20_032841 [Parelaphostrongylus tenuis]
MLKGSRIRETVNNTLQPRAVSAPRIPAATPVASNTHQFKVRSSSSSSPSGSLSNFAHSTAHCPNSKVCANDTKSISQSSTRPPSIIVPITRSHSFSRPTCSSTAKVRSSTSTEPFPAQKLSREELGTMIERLSVSRRVATAVTDTPSRMRIGQTHGVSCVKTRIRSRPTSLSC